MPATATLPETIAPLSKAVAVCHNCGASPLELAAGYSALRRVSSDCKAQPPGGRMGRCPECGLVQAVTDTRWADEARDIYGNYAIYHQSGGKEQSIFDLATGASRTRAQAIIVGLKRDAVLPAAGRLLDIGCGNGAFIQACSNHLPGWTFCASEYDARHRSTLEAIPRVEKFYSGDLDEITGKFDVISLTHVLEHISSPTAFLKRVAKLLKPDGYLLVEVPDCSINPFVLLVADHATHFTPGTLATAVARAGFDVRQVGAQWVPKEISLLARLAIDGDTAFSNADHLTRIARQLADLAAHGPFGIFGSSITATWAHAQSGSAAAFFVDEDPNRSGCTHEGRPIHNLEAIPSGAKVFVGLPEPLATTVTSRLSVRRPDVTFVLPST